MEWIESWSQPTAKHFNCCINLQADDPSPGSNCYNQGPERLSFNVINCYPAQLLPEMSKCKVRTAALHTAAMIPRRACWSSSPSRWLSPVTGATAHAATGHRSQPHRCFRSGGSKLTESASAPSHYSSRCSARARPIKGRVTPRSVNRVTQCVCNAAPHWSLSYLAP